MPVVCFEGASAVGKTALSEKLREKFDAAIVPEVNLLFAKPSDAPRFWYFKRQIERWQIAVEASKNHEIVVLDGDPFQPIWYNWAFGEDGAAFAAMMNFYREKLAAHEIRFPDKYFILTIDANELTRRKQADESRARRKFAEHRRFIQPQIAFFEFVKTLDENLVEFVENASLERSAARVIEIISDEKSTRQKKLSSLEVFDAVQIWVSKTSAKGFISAL